MEPEEIMDRFVHRRDVFSLQQSNGAYYIQRREITLQDIIEHLDGEKSVGVFTLDKDNTVIWACVDLDEKDEFKARLIHSYFQDFDAKLEFSGNKGYHIWIFFKKPVAASFAQNMVKARLNKMVNDYVSSPHYNTDEKKEFSRSIADIEVFPKQTYVSESKPYGNLVKLPLGIHRVSGKRSVFL